MPVNNKTLKRLNFLKRRTFLLRLSQHVDLFKNCLKIRKNRMKKFRKKSKCLELNIGPPVEEHYATTPGLTQEMCSSFVVW